MLVWPCCGCGRKSFFSPDAELLRQESSTVLWQEQGGPTHPTTQHGNDQAVGGAPCCFMLLCSFSLGGLALKNVHYKISGLEEIRAVCKDKTRKAISAPAFPSLTIMCAWPPTPHLLSSILRPCWQERCTGRHVCLDICWKTACVREGGEDVLSAQGLMG